MWHSHEDFIRDIVSLEDADAAESTYKVLQSYGRGMKTCEKAKFSGAVDPKSGFGFQKPLLKAQHAEQSAYLIMNFQLKPLGSGDELIEAYCRRNAPAPAPAKPLVASDSASEAGLSGSSPCCSKSDFYSTDTTRRTIACRNSKLQSNALINSLLSRMSIKENASGVSGDGEIDRVGKSIGVNDDYGEDGDGSLTSTFSSAPHENSSAETDHRKCISKNAIKTEENVEQKDFMIRDNGPLVDDFPSLKRH